MSANIRDIRKKATYDIWRAITNRDGGNHNDPRVVFERVDVLAGYVDVIVGAWYFRITPRYTPANGARVDVTTSTRATADVEHTFTNFATIVSEVTGDAGAQFRDIITRIVAELAQYARHNTCVVRHFCDDISEAIKRCSTRECRREYCKASEIFPFPSLRDGDAPLTYGNDTPTVNYIAGIGIGNSITVGDNTVTRIELGDSSDHIRNRISDYREGNVAAYKIEDSDGRKSNSIVFVVTGAAYGTCPTNSDADAILDIIDADPRTKVIEYCVSRDDIRFEIPEYGTFRVARNSDHDYEFSVYYEETGAHFFCGIGEDEWFDRCYDGDEDPDIIFAEKIIDIVDRCIAFADSNTFSVVSTTNCQHTVTEFSVASDYSNINAAHGYYDFSDVYADGETWGEWKRITFPPNNKCWDDARVIGQQPGDDKRPAVVTFEHRYTNNGGETYKTTNTVKVYNNE